MKDFPGLRRDVDMARFTAARLGGPADYLYVAKDPTFADIRDLLSEAWARDMPVTVIGGGANILVADAGIRGLVIINRAAQIRRDGAHLSAAGGTSLIHLSRYCQEAGLASMEWAIAVPGTVGGAVVNNAGAHGGDIAGSLTGARILEADGERWIDNAALEYGYRHSTLKARTDKKFFVLEAEFHLQPDDPSAIAARMKQYNDYRRRTQPPGASLGSIFKNPPGDYAGRLIEAAGLKGQRVGGVQVSPKHANFFVNTGDAKASDYLRLIRLVQSRVQQASGVELELEIQLIGDWQQIMRQAVCAKIAAGVHSVAQ